MFDCGRGLVEFVFLICYILLMDEYIVTISFDDDSQKWFAQNDDIPILLEDWSVDTLMKRVKIAVPEMLEINNMPHTEFNLIFKMETEAVVNFSSVA